LRFTLGRRRVFICNPKASFLNSHPFSKYVGSIAGTTLKAVVQRVTKGSVSVDGEVCGNIGKGLVILLGVRDGDTADDAQYLAEKCANLRLFSDDAGKFNLSCLDVKGEMLVVSQFTIYGDASKGRRPSFIESAPPEIAEPLYVQFMQFLRNLGLRVESGKFGAMMMVEIYNDGPVTLIVESKGG
jgi:D-tyrosyl-tRNA(Tyr) deacylase